MRKGGKGEQIYSLFDICGSFPLMAALVGGATRVSFFPIAKRTRKKVIAPIIMVKKKVMKRQNKINKLIFSGPVEERKTEPIESSTPPDAPGVGKKPKTK